MHARLWLLIAIARIAIDYPKKVVKYARDLRGIVFDKSSFHILMKHFAAQALLTCAEAGKLKLTSKEMVRIKNVNTSPFPRLKQRPKEGVRNNPYERRPKEAPKVESEFSLDYDFEKYSVSNLSDIFGRQTWEVKDIMTKTIRKHDKNIESMYDKGGRSEERYDHTATGMNSKFTLTVSSLVGTLYSLPLETYLSKYPVTDDRYEDEPWEEFLNREVLTRKDGLWLSDGVDRTPLDAKINLLEKGKEDLQITGERNKILSLIGLTSNSSNDLIVDGRWNSHDDIRVHIYSVLISATKVKILARQLIREVPFSVWGSSWEQHQDEFVSTDFKGCIPWVAHSSLEAKLDGDDSLSSISVVRRAYFSERILLTLFFSKQMILLRFFGKAQKIRFWRNQMLGVVVVKDKMMMRMRVIVFYVQKSF